MSISTTNTSMQNLDELDRQLKQAEMIRQYLQVTNSDANSQSIKQSTTESEPSITSMFSLSSINLNDLRKDLRVTEERVERLREELKELRKKRDDSYLKTSLPPPYTPPSMNSINSELTNPNISISSNRGISDRSTSPRQSNDNTRVSSILLPTFNSVNHVPGGVSAAFADHLAKDHRQRQFLLTMRQHREQLVVYLDSLKQALHSLEQLASLEPTRTEVHLANIKLDTIHQKSRQLRALKSSRLSQQSPFIECRIRQLEHDLIRMLNEHQKDVQAKLELNEQRSLMLLKIIQLTDELTSVDQQIQQLSSNIDKHLNLIINLDEQRVSFRDPTDHNLLTKLYYHHHH